MKLKAMKRIVNKFKNPRVLRGSIMTIIGYLLSPLSWWNDAFLNIPIALALAKITSLFVPVSFSILFTIFYWATNVLGFILMYLGGEDVVITRNNIKRSKTKTLVYSILISLAYTIIVVEIFKLISH